MKNLKMILAAVALCFATVTASANESNPKPAKESIALHTEITSLLGLDFPNYVMNQKEVKANVYLMVNNNNELVVVSVTSKDRTLKSIVKSKLNYKEVSVKGIKKGEIYKMPLTVKQS